MNGDLPRQVFDPEYTMPSKKVPISSDDIESADTIRKLLTNAYKPTGNRKECVVITAPCADKVGEMFFNYL